MTHVLICQSCGVVFWDRDKCPSCGGPGGVPFPTPEQPGNGGGLLCMVCRHRGKCPADANLVRFSGGEIDDEMCMAFDGCVFNKQREVQ
jgi:hypothetical protein